MVPGQWGIDIFDELMGLGYNEFVVPSAVVDELEILKNKVKGGDRAALSIAINLSKKCEIVQSSGETVDEAVESTAKELNAPVFTNDAVLRQKLKRAGIRTIFMRSRQKLVVE